MPAPKPRGYWTLERCQESAMPYSTKAAWREGDHAGYDAAKRHRLVDACCGHMTAQHTYWTLDALKADAIKYSSRTEWQQAGGGGYSTASARGVREECCAHMTGRNQYRNWTLESCRMDAKKHTLRSLWKHDEVSGRAAYQAATKNGWLDGCCAHMEDRSPTDNDTVYIWRSIGQYYKGSPVYKIGVTSARLGDLRIRRNCQRNRQTADIIIMRHVQDATSVEAVLHILGEHPGYTEGDGYTEFRALSDSELQEAIQYIEEVAA